MLYRGRAAAKPEAFKAARLAAGLTQAALAAEIGCTDAMVAHAETGRRSFGLVRLVLASQAMGVPLSQIADTDVTAEELAALAKAVA